MSGTLTRETHLVLIAERDQHVREFQAYFLEKAGLAVEFVDDGEAALHNARLQLPSVVVTEIMIPKIDGLSLCRRLRADPLTRDIPVIVFSILAAAARAKEAGASVFLRKPLVESVFLGAIRDAIPAESTARMEQQ